MLYLCNAKIKTTGPMERHTTEAAERKLMQAVKTDFESRAFGLISLGEVSFTDKTETRKAIVNGDFCEYDDVFVSASCTATFTFVVDGRDFSEALHVAQVATNNCTRKAELLDLKITDCPKENESAKKVWRASGCGSASLVSSKI